MSQKAWVKNADTVTLAAPYAVASGGGALIGSIFGIAVDDVASGTLMDFSTMGIWDVAKDSSIFADGAPVYWNDVSRQCSANPTGQFIGLAAMVARNEHPAPGGASSDTTVRVRLNAAFSDPAQAVALTGETAWLGDSITLASSDGSTYFGGTSFPTQVAILSGQQVYMTAPNENWGVAGDTTAQMLARLPALLTANSTAGWVHILGGTNDVGNSVALATSIANLTTIIGLIRASGKLPIIGTIPPRTGFVSGVQAYNAAVRGLGRSLAVPVVDYYSVLVNTTGTGVYQTGYDSGDGIHPNPVGWGVMAKKFVSDMAPVYPKGGVLLAAATTDGLNILTNPLMQTPSAGLPSSWLLAGTAPVAMSTTAASAPAVGNVFTTKWLGSGATSPGYIYQNGVATTSGHRYFTSFRISISGLSAVNGVASQAPVASIDMGNAINIMVYAYAGDVVNGIVAYEYTSTGASNSIQFNINFGTSTTPITLSLSQAECIDLTALGLSNAAPFTTGSAQVNPAPADASITSAALVPTTQTGNMALQVAHCTYSFAVDGGGAPGLITPLANAQLPANAVVYNAAIEWTTAGTGATNTTSIGFTGTGGGPAKLLAATAVASLTGRVQSVVVPQTASTWVKITTAGVITLTTATAALTAGVCEIYVFYFVSST